MRAVALKAPGRTGPWAVRAVEWGLRLALAGIYLFAAYEKILDPLEFSRAIYNYRILPVEAVAPLALVLPVWEALAGLGLILGRAYRGALLSVLLMSLVFAAGVGSAMARGLDLSCGCFGSGAESKADLWHILLNLSTAAATVWLLRMHIKRNG